MPSREELLSLCERLRGERLLVSSELELLQELNTSVDKSLTNLIQRAWLCRQQQLNLFKLIYSHPDATPQNSFRQVRQLSKTQFIESYHRLGPHDSLVGAIFQTLLRNPTVVAKILNLIDSQLDAANITFDLSHILFSSLYGCCVFASDEKVVLQTLFNLMRLQLAPNTNPRRLIRRGSCAFSKLYKLFTEGLFSAKVFLTAALHEPVMELLSQDELFLDIDPSKAVIRFPPDERLRRFGEEGTEKFKQNLEKYRKVILNKLISISGKFIEGIRQAMPQFPSSLAWLVRQLYQLLLAGQKVSKEEVSLLCTDLIFTCFICPAIANPEPLGVVSDTPITYIARFNLMQVGQILQTLAVWPWERVDSKLMDLYGQFDQVFDKKNEPIGKADKRDKYKDPNDQQYMTLAGIDNQVFDEQPKDGAKPKPSPGQPQGYKDPRDQQYMTLAGIDNQIFDEPKDGAKPKPSPGQPQGYKDPRDQQYMTLAGIDNQIFDEPKDGAKPKPSPGQPQGYKDPRDQQYMTLAGLDNQVFDQQEPDHPSAQPYPPKPKGRPSAAPPRRPRDPKDKDKKPPRDKQAFDK